MSTDQWIEYNGVEFINLSRTVQLAEALDIDILWTEASEVSWIEDSFHGSPAYDIIENAPWYDPDFPASAEFAGLVPLSIVGLDDSSLVAETIEYVTDGGSSGKPRNKTLPIVASVAILASTTRGADYGRRWMDRVLGAGGSRTFCSGSDLRYFRHAAHDGLTPPIDHRRDVSLTRGISITRKRTTDCAAMWTTTFTWTANDPFEYGEAQEQFIELGNPGGVQVPAGFDPVIAQGVLSMTEEPCPVYNYDPIYDPLHPALVPPPTAPTFYPAGWSMPTGAEFTRYWATIADPEPSVISTVPVVKLTTNEEARMVRVSIWSGADDPEAQCDPLWTAIVSYLPPGVDFYIDGEQRAAYLWDGVSEFVRRTDSLVYGTDAHPIEWVSVNDTPNLRISLDVREGDGYDGGGGIRAALSLVPKSG